MSGQGTGYIQNFMTSRDNSANGASFVGQIGRIWYNPDTNWLYVSDGVTPGGIPLAGGGGGGGDCFNDIDGGSAHSVYLTAEQLPGGSAISVATSNIYGGNAAAQSC